jgi:hypothetical protein
MSVSSVRAEMSRVVREAFENNNGEIDASGMKAVIDEAKRFRLGSREVEAVLQPGAYLDGVDLGGIRFTAEAYKLAESLASDHGVDLFPELPNAKPTAAAPRPDAPSAASLRDNFNAAMAKGKDLGDIKDWSVDTAGANVKFTTNSAGRSWPALVLDKREFKDPGARDIVKDNVDAFKGVKTVEDFKAALDGVLEKESAYFSAEGVDVKNPNENFGIRNLRRKSFIDSLHNQAIGLTDLSGSDATKAKGLVEGASISLVSGVDYDMKVGSHTNYWPYWDNYAPPLEKMLEQTEEVSDEHFQIKNRLRDIYRRKTHKNSWGRSINERNFESSIRLALVHNPQYTSGAGHRVSVTEGSTPFAPKYELLTVKASGLPEGMEKYAGLQLVRDTDANNTLRFDFMGEGDSEQAKLAKSMLGKAIPEELKAHIDSKALSKDDLDDLTMRDFVSGEKARKDISMDWDSNGSINVAEISIGWWGHCHNEAPLNAMDIDPSKDVKFYRANRGVDAEKALSTYSTDDAWDIAGAFVSDHEGRPEWAVASTGRATYSVDDTEFVGSRNDGGHALALHLPGGRKLEVDAEVKKLTNADGEGLNPKSIFRENLENDDGSFSSNGQHLSTEKGDSITIDVTKHSMSLDTEYYTFGSDGYPVKKTGSVTLDPTKDEFVKLSEDMSRSRGGLGGTITEHHYNAKTEEYFSVTKTVGEDNNFEPKETTRSEPVSVSQLTHTTETEYDSPQEIYEFFMDNPGMAKTYDTTSGKAVWNYPVNREKLDMTNEVVKEENGRDFTYRTFNLAYETMGGPNKSQKFILKYNEAGKIVDSCALDPMPDFAYRNDHWESAPVTTDSQGRTAFNVMALDKGYLLSQGGNSFDDIVTDMWHTQATLLYASLTDETPEGHAFIFQAQDGKIISFENQEDFNAAVEADKSLRSAESGE